MPFHRVRALSNVNDMAELFMQLFLYVADRHAPVYCKRFPSSGPKVPDLPFDPVVATWQASKRYYHDSFKTFGRAADFEQFRFYRNLVKKRINKLRANRCFAALSQPSLQPSSVWKEAKRICHLQPKKVTPIVDPQSAAEHYRTVGAKTASAAKLNNVNNVTFTAFLDDDCACRESFSLIRFTGEDIHAAFRSLKSNAPGCDYASKNLIADAFPAILPTLKFIYNTSISTGVFPQVWKHALITPVYKGCGSLREPVSYRPISLLSLFGKLLELLVKLQLELFIETNDRLPKWQSGFRRGYSTETAVLSLSSDVFRRMGKGEVVLIASLDLSKAFDTVSHDIMLQNLEYHGIRDTALAWFESFLRPRTQQVNVNGQLSSAYFVDTGVPQGSILSPLLYIIYTADMATCLHRVSYFSYADDTQLIHSGCSKSIDAVKAELQNDFERVAQWAASNLLKLNAGKTQLLVVKDSAVHVLPIQLKLQGQLILPSDTMKILGVVFDSTMSFMAHADLISNRVTGFLQMIVHRRNKLPRPTLIMLINAYISSQLMYCLSAVGISSAVCDKFQKLQNYAVRVVFGLQKFSHVSHLRKKLNWLPMSQQIELRFGAIAHRAVHGKTPGYLRLNLSDFLPAHSYPTRSNNLRLPRARNRFCDMTFEARCIKMYNRCEKKEIWAEGHSEFMRRFSEEMLNNF
jgi:hypothetical protein